jgi:hypothetical protein
MRGMRGRGRGARRKRPFVFGAPLFVVVVAAPCRSPFPPCLFVSPLSSSQADPSAQARHQGEGKEHMIPETGPKQAGQVRVMWPPFDSLRFSNHRLTLLLHLPVAHLNSTKQGLGTAHVHSPTSAHSNRLTAQQWNKARACRFCRQFTLRFPLPPSLTSVHTSWLVTRMQGCASTASSRTASIRPHLHKPETHSKLSSKTAA